MAPLPKRKISRSRQRKRRGAIKLKITTLVACSNCGQKKIAHRVCSNCGYYNGKQVVKLKKGKTDKNKKQ